jgi:heptosyltransferase-3
MGDCVLLTGPVRALKEEFPGFRIAVLVEARFASCFEGNPDFNEVLIAGSKVSTAGMLLKRRFHLTINLHGGPTSLVYSFFPWGRRIGVEHYRGAKLYNGLVPSPRPTVHTVESTMELLQWLGLKSQSAPALRYERHSVEAKRFQEKLAGREYVVIHPGAIMETKRWDALRFAQVARGLAARGLTIVVTSGPGEEAFAGRVARELQGTVILLGLTIPELAELIRGAKLYVGNDSGPMHLAAASVRRQSPCGAHRIRDDGGRGAQIIASSKSV